MQPYPDYRIAVEAIIVHDGKVLLTRRADNGAWYVPAGKAKYEETPREAIVRETRVTIPCNRTYGASSRTC